jgi:hypothetical protein
VLPNSFESSDGGGGGGRGDDPVLCVLEESTVLIIPKKCERYEKEKNEQFHGTNRFFYSGKSHLLEFSFTQEVVFD